MYIKYYKLIRDTFIILTEFTYTRICVDFLIVLYYALH